MIQLSAIIPSYNRPKDVERLVSRLLKDLPQQCEVIVVAQGLDVPSSNDARVRIVHQGKPGLPRARNTGIDHAGGEILLFLDDDCVPMDGLVRQHLDLHARRPEYSVIAGAVHDTHNQGDKEHVLDFDKTTLSYICDYAKDTEEEVDGFPGGHSSFKRNVFGAIRFDPWFRGNARFEEVDVAMRLRRAGGRILFSSTASIQHLLQHDGGCRSELTRIGYEYNRFFNSGLCFAKNVSLSFLARFLTKQRHDLEYLSRSNGTHDPWIVVAGLLGVLSGVLAGVARRYLGKHSFRP